MPIPLDYATPLDDHLGPSPTKAFVGATLAFAAAHLCVEWLTYRTLVFNFQVLGPATQPREIKKLEDRFFVSMIVEIAYVIPACAIVLFTQAAIYRLAPAKAQPLPRHGWAAGVAAGFTYCWVRCCIWGLTRIKAMDYPDSTDFAVSIVVAGLVGAILGGWWRRWRIFSSGLSRG